MGSESGLGSSSVMALTENNSPGNAVISPTRWESQQLKADPLRAWPLYDGGIYVPLVADWVTPL